MVAEFAQSLVDGEAPEDVPVLHLFNGPYVTVGTRRLNVPEGSQRLLVFVSLRSGRVCRRQAAGTLWPIGDEGRAAGNLRSSLWRLNRLGEPLLIADGTGLRAREDLLIDMHTVNAWASRLIAGRATRADLSIAPRNLDALELLPGWYDDWALIERERLRQRLLHALEAQSRQLVLAGLFAEAIEAAMIAVSAEPLRESAQRSLIEAHLAEGNLVEARRVFDAYAVLVARELHARPTPELQTLVRPPAPTHPPRHTGTVALRALPVT
ncbi:BTAD domain-containing putative transcriptional regulator [Streptomyces sp. NPDC059010]|uniref:AfsR/SARP family transcriptional regulator n=1 Tax=Streptomyces sp. NPDC059010 TaxID=3346695 RepID=UPI00368DA2F4